MQVPLDITFQNSEPSEAIRSEVAKQAKRLEKFHDRITSCHVTVIADDEAPARRSVQDRYLPRDAES
jgi:ribosome-associated translation inhibitor RaiA